MRLRSRTLRIGNSILLGLLALTAMSGGLAARVGLLVIATALLAGPTAQAQDHARLMPQTGTEQITSVAFSRDGRLLLTGSWDHTAMLWDMASGLQIRSFAGHTDNVTSVAFSPDGRSVLTGSYDKTARLWDAFTGQQIRSFEGHTNWVKSVAFSPDGRFVLTGSADTTTRLWNAATGNELATLISFENGGSGAALTPMISTEELRCIGSSMTTQCDLCPWKSSCATITRRACSRAS